jgi:hypothetical protein
MKALLLKRKDEFARTVSEKMYAYALARGLESYDVPMVRLTVKRLAGADYKVGTLVREIVSSYAFQHRRGTEPLAQQQ